jgi:hypothetical protein
MGFSHAYYGATRHAITVGFVSLMIVGVAAKVVPTLNGVNTKELSALWGPFLLINAGCLLRVTGQTLTDFTPLAFPVAGVSGLLEVTGLGLWGAHLVLIMCGRARIRHSRREAIAPLESRDILLSDTVGAVLAQYPELLGTFLTAGFTPLSSPHARRTIARVITIQRACRQTGINAEQFLAQINAQRQKTALVELPQVCLSAVKGGRPDCTGHLTEADGGTAGRSP